MKSKKTNKVTGRKLNQTMLTVVETLKFSFNLVFPLKLALEDKTVLKQSNFTT